MVNKEDKVVDLVFKQKLEQQQQIKRRKRKRRTRRIFTFLTIVGVLTLYFMTDVSKPKAISIKGNAILEKEDVMEAAGIKSDSNLLLANPLLLTYRLKKHPFIVNASTKTSLFKRVISIDVEELKIFAYRQGNEETSMILFDGSSQTLKPELYNLLPDIIYIDGFEEEEDQKRLVESFSELDDSVLNQISEIHQTSVSYDDKLIQVSMKNGNKVLQVFKQ